MKYLTVLVAILVLAACSTGPATRNESQAVSHTQLSSPEVQKASIDSAIRFLLAAAAADFRAHGPSGPVRFRDVHVGHVMAPNGGTQYLLCGQVLGGKGEWTPFATIKTSGYEQYLGAQATGFCQGSSVIWDKKGDLSSSLQSCLDSL